MHELLYKVFSLQNTSYWLLVIWCIGAGLVLYPMPKADVLVQGKVEQRWYWFSVLLFVAPYILWAAYRSGFGDTYAYALIFNRAPTSIAGLRDYLATAEDVDPGFYLFITIIKMIGISRYETFFLIVAVIQVLCMCYTFRRYSTNFWLCIFLFIASTDYMSWMFNGMRQFIATCLIFAAFDLLVKRKYRRYICVVLLASTFHGSAILMLPLSYIMNGPALNRKTMLTILATGLLIPFIDVFLPFLESSLVNTQYGDIMSDSSWTNDDGTNIIRVLVYSAPALIALFGRRYIKNSADRVLNLCINASMITMALYLVSAVTSGIYIGRLPIYTTLYGYMSISTLIDMIFEKQTSRLIHVIMVTFYLLFFIYQMRQWGVI